MTKLKRSRISSNLLSFIGIVVICILLNNLGTKLNGLLGLPLYIDNIGTLLSAMLGGYLPCITVGFLSNIINGISSPSSIYYCIISVFIAVAAVMFSESLRRVRISRIIWAIVIFALLGGGLGGLLTWMIYGFNFGEGFAVDFAASIDEKIHIGYFASNMISTFLVDFADKAVVTIISLIIYKLLPSRLADYLKARAWYYDVLVEKKKMEGVKRTSLRVKITLLVALSTTLVAAAAILTSVLQYNAAVIEDYTSQASDAADVIVSHTNPMQVYSVLRDGSDAKGYAATKELMTTIRDANPEIEFVYIYRVEEDGTHVLFDLDTEEVAADLPGDVIEYDDTIKKYIRSVFTGRGYSRRHYQR